MGQFLLTAGAHGKRYAMPHATILMHQPSGGIGGTASDIRIQAEQMLYIKRTLFERTAFHTGQTVEQIEKDADRDRWFTAEEAEEYGFVDHVIRSALEVPSVVLSAWGRTYEAPSILTKGEPNVTELSRYPQSRYVLPSFVERTSYGIKEMNPYNKLFEERIIFLGVQIDDASANDVMAQLLTLEAIDPDREITMYINSPGGSMTSMMAIYDTMQFIQPDITTCCIGQAASAAAVLLAAGTKGKRMALPNSRILIHQPATEGGYGQSSDMEIQAREILRMRTAMEVIIARHTGKNEEVIRRDIERDKFLTAAEAMDYGMIDEVLTVLKRGTERIPEVVSS
jgi:ATP-dependent Clp protease, protease subunit